MSRTQKIVYAAICGLLLVVVKEPLARLPGVELVTLTVILLARHLERLCLYGIYVFVFIQAILYMGIDEGMWILSYLYVWAALYLVARVFRRNDKPLFWALAAGFYGLAFGTLCSPPYFLYFGPGVGLAKWITGFRHDIPHGIANFFVVLYLFRPLDKQLHKILSRARG